MSNALGGARRRRALFHCVAGPELKGIACNGCFINVNVCFQADLLSLVPAQDHKSGGGGGEEALIVALEAAKLGCSM